MIHLFNCPDNALIMVTHYILNTSAEADGLIRSTKRNRRHEKAGEVGSINIQETQIAKLIQCQRMALPQQCLAASTVQTRLGFRCSSVQTRFTCFVSRHDSRVLCPDMIHLFNCPDNALIMVTHYILNTIAEADGLVRSTKRNRRHEKAGEVGTINIQETQIAKLIQCQRMA